MRTKYYIVIFSSLVALVLDQLTKNYFQTNQGSQFILWEPLLIFEFTANYNIAFGLPINSIIFIFLLILVLGLLIYLIWQTWIRKEFLQFSLILIILAGATGNIIDRIRLGYVIDFINVPFWSVFNLADIFIVVSVGVWLIYLLFYESKRKKIPEKS